MKPLWDGRIKLHSNGSGHMTKMADTPISDLEILHSLLCLKFSEAYISAILSCILFKFKVFKEHLVLKCSTILPQLNQPHPHPTHPKDLQAHKNKTC